MIFEYIWFVLTKALWGGVDTKFLKNKNERKSFVKIRYKLGSHCVSIKYSWEVGKTVSKRVISFLFFLSVSISVSKTSFHLRLHPESEMKCWRLQWRFVLNALFWMIIDIYYHLLILFLKHLDVPRSTKRTQLYKVFYEEYWVINISFMHSYAEI